MNNTILKLERAAKRLGFAYRIHSKSSSVEICEKAFKFFQPEMKVRHVSIGDKAKIRLNTDEHEFSFSNIYLSDGPAYLIFSDEENVFELKEGYQLSTLVNQCAGMEYFVVASSLDMFISVNWYVIEIIADYYTILENIKQCMSRFDATTYSTIKEAEESIHKYDYVLSQIVYFLEVVLDNIGSEDVIVEEIIQLLANYIGDAQDMERYGSLIDELYANESITSKQRSLFYENANTGRWK